MTTPFDRAHVEKLGFVGFLTVKHLVVTRCREVPSKPGIYVVARAASTAPRFRARSVGGWFKGEDPTVPTAILRGRWVPDTPVLYLGMAGTNLRERIRALVDFGNGKDVGHRGGRYLWQLPGSSDLLVGWKTTTNARAAEVRLFLAFEKAHGRLPFANLQH